MPKMRNKKPAKKEKKIKVLGKVYPRIKPSELAEVAEELGADVITERENIIKMARSINRRYRHPR